MFQILRDISPVAVLMFDREGKLISVNRRWTEFTGQLEQDALGSGWCDVVAESGRAHFVGRFMDAVGLGEETVLPISLLPKAKNLGIKGKFCFHGVPHRDTSGSIVGFVATVSKAIEVEPESLSAKTPSGKLSAETVVLAKKVAQEVSAAKSQFLGNISHELRTPLNGIIGVADLLSDTELTKEQQEYLAILRGCSGTLVNLVNDLLDYSTVDSEDVDLKEVKFNLADSIAGLMRVLDIQARAKNQELVSFIEEDVPDVLYGDIGRLKQVLSNLIGNAIKFTLQGGGILLIGAFHSSKENIVTLRFSIADSGIGIAEDHLERIFEPFTQLDGSLTRKNGGIGLGLSLSSTLVNLLGGKIWCESKEGVGSTFHFTAQFKVLDPKPRRPFLGTSELPSNLRILVVQPNLVAAEHINMILKKWSSCPRGVGKGDDACAQVSAEIKAGNGYEIAIVDAVLPDSDGFSVAQKIKVLDPKLKVMMLLSTDNYYEGLRRVNELSLDGAILKPVTHSSLLDALMSLFAASRQAGVALEHADTLLSRGWLSTWGREGLSPSSSASRLPKDSAKHSILVVEDNFANQRVFQGVLEKGGYQISGAWNGTEALAALESGSYDLVIMDSNLPSMSGLDVIRKVREREKVHGGHLPIVSVTANSGLGNREACLEAGADDYLAKPFSNEDLLEVVRNTIERLRK